MAVEVRIPTILRSYTDGAKAVEGSGATLDDARSPTSSRGTPGCASGSWRTAQLRRFVNVYVNDEDVRFLGGLATPVADGDAVTILPAVAGGALSAPSALRLLLESVGRTPLVGLPRLSPSRRTYASGPSSRTATRPARSRTARRWRWSRPPRRPGR